MPEPCTSCNQNGLYIFGDVIMLRPRQSNPVAAFQRISNTVPQVVTSDLQQYNTDPIWGFRTGFGLLCDDGCLFQATYTQFKDLVSTQTFVVPDLGAEGSASITFVGPGQLSGTSLTEVGSTFQADWNLQLHQIDLVFGTVFSPAECLDLTVTAGARIAWLDQRYRVLFSDSNGISAQDQKMDLEGFGPIMNTEARVHLKPGCSLVGRGSTALLLANREDNGTVTITDPLGTVLAIRKASYDREEIIPILELGFGAEFCCCDGHVTVGTGYEFIYWFELGSSYTELADSQRRVATKGDISLDGFYIRVTILF
jgi:hypothetical protein